MAARAHRHHPHQPRRPARHAHLATRRRAHADQRQRRRQQTTSSTAPGGTTTPARRLRPAPRPRRTTSTTSSRPCSPPRRLWPTSAARTSTAPWTLTVLDQVIGGSGTHPGLGDRVRHPRRLRCRHPHRGERPAGRWADPRQRQRVVHLQHLAGGLPGSVEDVAADLDITGDAGDVLATLTSPAGTVVTLTNGNGGVTDAFFGGTTFADVGGLVSGPVSDLLATLLGHVALVAPQEPLSALLGESDLGPVDPRDHQPERRATDPQRLGPGPDRVLVRPRRSADPAHPDPVEPRCRHGLHLRGLGGQRPAGADHWRPARTGAAAGPGAGQRDQHPGLVRCGAHLRPRHVGAGRPGGRGLRAQGGHRRREERDPQPHPPRSRRPAAQQPAELRDQHHPRWHPAVAARPHPRRTPPLPAW